MKLLQFIIIALLFSRGVFAVQPSEILSDPVLEARARSISADLRCLVCQNQSIDDSDADLAHDLRVLVRQHVQAGESDAQVKQFLVDRYGSYILLNPPLNSTTIVLWVSPLLMLLIGGGLGWMILRRRESAFAQSEPELSKLEQERLAALLASPSSNDEIRKPGS